MKTCCAAVGAALAAAARLQRRAADRRRCRRDRLRPISSTRPTARTSSASVSEATQRDVETALARASAFAMRLADDGAGAARRHHRARGRPVRGKPRRADGAGRARSRQVAAERDRRNPRSGRLPALLRGAGPRHRKTSLALGPVTCISPWNFPLAIFTGQVAAALAAGNVVLAKPAEQTPLIAHRAVELFHEAGIPKARAAVPAGPRRSGRRRA